MKTLITVFMLMSMIGCASVGTVTTPQGEEYKVKVTGNAKFSLKTEDFDAKLERKPIVDLKLPDLTIEDLDLQD